MPFVRDESTSAPLAVGGAPTKVPCVSTEVIAPVVVASEFVVEDSVTKSICEAVFVALPRFCTTSAVDVAPDAVFVIVNIVDEAYVRTDVDAASESGEPVSQSNVEVLCVTCAL